MNEPSIDELAQQIQNAVDHLPAELKPEEVEALIMTIAQGYAPDLNTAFQVILNAAFSMKGYIEAVREAKAATKQ